MDLTKECTQIALPHDLMVIARKRLAHQGIQLEHALSLFLHELILRDELPSFLSKPSSLQTHQIEIIKRIEAVRNKLIDRDGANVWKESPESHLNGRLRDLCRNVQL